MINLLKKNPPYTA
jgi:hypothetical protein